MFDLDAFDFATDLLGLEVFCASSSSGGASSIVSTCFLRDAFFDVALLLSLVLSVRDFVLRFDVVTAECSSLTPDESTELSTAFFGRPRFLLTTSADMALVFGITRSG